MKKLRLLIPAFLSLALLGGAVAAYAQPDINSLTKEVGEKSGFAVDQVNDTSLSETVGRIVRVALSLVGTGFFVLMLYAGFLWMTARGSDEQVEKSMGIIKTAVIGLVITLGAYGITTYIVTAVQQTSANPETGLVGPGY